MLLSVDHTPYGAQQLPTSTCEYFLEYLKGSGFTTRRTFNPIFSSVHELTWHCVGLRRGVLRMEAEEPEHEYTNCGIMTSRIRCILDTKCGSCGTTTANVWKLKFAECTYCEGCPYYLCQIIGDNPLRFEEDKN